MQKSLLSGEENSISYLIFSHIFNMAVWKCVKQYVTYHPHKETYNPCLTTNCNHRKEKVIHVFINTCLLHVILQCHMWLMLIKLHTSVFCNCYKKAYKLCILYSIPWLQEIFNSCTNVKNAHFLNVFQFSYLLHKALPTTHWLDFCSAFRKNIK
jgi:hypothetical protein